MQENQYEKIKLLFLKLIEETKELNEVEFEKVLIQVFKENDSFSDEIKGLLFCILTGSYWYNNLRFITLLMRCLLLFSFKAECWVLHMLCIYIDIFIMLQHIVVHMEVFTCFIIFVFLFKN